MGGLFNSLLYLLLVIGVTLLIREIVCWYWKMNDTVSLLKKQNDQLTEQIDLMKTQNKIMAAVGKEISKLNARIDEAETDEEG